MNVDIHDSWKTHLNEEFEKPYFKELSEFVNEQITEVYYNIDKSLENMADGQTFQGISHQKYVLTAANSLADFLAEVMDNMQESMSMSQGQGQGQDMQLPDIIMSQEEINKMMEEGLKESQQGKQSKEGEQEENGKEPGENGEPQNQGEGSTDDGQGQLFEIYQQQQQLREALEDQIKKNGISDSGQSLLKEMETLLE